MGRNVDEEIEENVRFCEELMKRNPNFVPEEPVTDLDDQEESDADDVTPFVPSAGGPAKKGTDDQRGANLTRKKRDICMENRTQFFDLYRHCTCCGGIAFQICG